MKGKKCNNNYNWTLEIGENHSVPGKITNGDSCFQSEKGRHMLHCWTCEALFCHLGWRELLRGFREGELQEMRSSWARSFLLMPGTCSQHCKPHTSFSKGERDQTIYGTQPRSFQRWIATFPWPWGETSGLDSLPRPAQSQPGRVLPVICDLTENGSGLSVLMDHSHLCRSNHSTEQKGRGANSF